MSAIRMISFGALAAVLAGCGSATYDERLAATDQRNRYFARLDGALDGYWNQQAWGIWFRPPKGLTNVPAPPKPKEGEEPEPDRRLEYQGVPLDLPGIIDVWEGKLPISGGGTGPCRLYLLGNHYRFARQSADGESSDPKTFFYDLEIVLQNLYQVTLPNGDGGRGDKNNERSRQQIPSSEQFGTSRAFVTVTFAPQQEGGQPFNAWLYEHTAGQVQFAVLLFVPPEASNDARQSLITALETLQVSSQTPGFMPGGSSAPGGAGRGAGF